MLTSLCQQVIVVVHQRVVAPVVHRQVALVHRQVVAVPHQQVVAAALEQVAVVQRAFSGRILQIELCLPLQVAIASSFYLPPRKFCS